MRRVQHPREGLAAQLGMVHLEPKADAGNWRRSPDHRKPSMLTEKFPPHEDAQPFHRLVHLEYPSLLSHDADREPSASLTGSLRE